MKKVLSLFSLAFAFSAFAPHAEAKEMKVKITLDNQVHYATLADNPSARSLFQQLPFTLPLEDYAASEKIARPLSRQTRRHHLLRAVGQPGLVLQRQR